ncbi:unnamed protein product [Albugo candida]|uniref:Uncharacterized protein n=1 Tax=Albugo candida TaxID=65357 RepID=A0A024GBG0_9STRA|nr:unnamed protein product [Albugo candida]|eukprot:CCI43989.1 unnamed protein product [Albugo candida]
MTVRKVYAVECKICSFRMNSTVVIVSIHHVARAPYQCGPIESSSSSTAKTTHPILSNEHFFPSLWHITLDRMNENVIINYKRNNDKKIKKLITFLNFYFTKLLYAFVTFHSRMHESDDNLCHKHLIHKCLTVVEIRIS